MTDILDSRENINLSFVSAGLSSVRIQINILFAI